MAYQDLAAALADRANAIAEAILGEPSFRHPNEYRWGKRGSLSVRVSGKRRGFWYDHERGEGGDLVALIARERGVDRNSAYQIAKNEFLGIETRALRRPGGYRSDKHEDDDGRLRVARALRLWSEGIDIVGTPAETYLLKHRGIDVSALDLDHALRWHPRTSAILALMTSPAAAEPGGVHRTFLDADARKIERKMLGHQGIIRISSDAEVTNSLTICEGIEDALSILLSGWRPVWAATSAGAIARLPVLNAIEALTIFADLDDAGLNAAERCAEIWRANGRETAVCLLGGENG